MTAQIFVSRKFNDLDFTNLTRKNLKTVTFHDVTNVRIIIEKLRTKNKHIDIGQFAYTNRKDNTKNLCSRNKHVLVEPSSFLKHRVEPLRNLVHAIANVIITGKASLQSLPVEYKKFRDFLNWCEKNNHQNCFVSIKKAKEAFTNFIDYLREISRNTNHQKHIKNIFLGCLILIKKIFQVV